jgi:trans-aconitate methyltransferase
VDADLLTQFADIQWTHWWFRGRRAVVDDVLAQRLPGAQPRRILEVGCGTGAMVPVLSRYGTVTGMDSSEEATAECKKLFPEHTFLTGAVPDDLPRETFDVVAAFDVLEHIADDVGALRRISDLLGPGGLLVVTVPAYGWLWSAHDDLSHHVRRYRRRELRAALEAAGYEVERATYFNTVLFPVAAGVRLTHRHVTHRRDTNDFALPPRRVNQLLSRLFAAERRPLRHVDLPFGVSVLALARRR